MIPRMPGARTRNLRILVAVAAMILAGCATDRATDEARRDPAKLYALGREALDGVHADLVVAHDLHLGAQLAQVLHHVPGEGIVVVDHQDHNRPIGLISLINPCARPSGRGADARRFRAAPRAHDAGVHSAGELSPRSRGA